MAAAALFSVAGKGSGCFGSATASWPGAWVGDAAAAAAATAVVFRVFEAAGKSAAASWLAVATASCLDPAACIVDAAAELFGVAGSANLLEAACKGVDCFGAGTVSWLALVGDAAVAALFVVAGSARWPEAADKGMGDAAKVASCPAEWPGDAHAAGASPAVCSHESALRRCALGM